MLTNHLNFLTFSAHLHLLTVNRSPSRFQAVGVRTDMPIFVDNEPVNREKMEIADVGKFAIAYSLIIWNVINNSYFILTK